VTASKIQWLLKFKVLFHNILKETETKVCLKTYLINGNKREDLFHGVFAILQ
jgi:hypothetical protein